MGVGGGWVRERGDRGNRGRGGCEPCSANV